MKPRHQAAAIIAIAAIALPAAAQEWRIELSNPTLTPESPSTEITISVFVPGPDLFGYAELATHATERGWEEATFESLISHPGQNPGALSPDGRSVLDQQIRRLFVFGGPLPNPQPAWRATFTATDFSSREITITTETGQFGVYADLRPVLEPRTPIEGQAVIQVIPAPGAGALALGLGLLAARRRRTTSAGRKSGSALTASTTSAITGDKQ